MATGKTIKKRADCKKSEDKSIPDISSPQFSARLPNFAAFSPLFPLDIQDYHVLYSNRQKAMPYQSYTQTVKKQCLINYQLLFTDKL